MSSASDTPATPLTTRAAVPAISVAPDVRLPATPRPVTGPLYVAWVGDGYMVLTDVVPPHTSPRSTLSVRVGADRRLRGFPPKHAGCRGIWRRPTGQKVFVLTQQDSETADTTSSTVYIIAEDRLRQVLDRSVDRLQLVPGDVAADPYPAVRLWLADHRFSAEDDIS